MTLSLKHIFLFGVITITGVYGAVQYLTYKKNSISFVQSTQADTVSVVAKASLRNFKVLVSEYETLLNTAADMLSDHNVDDQSTVSHILKPIFNNFTGLSAIYYGGSDNGLIGFRRIGGQASSMHVKPTDPTKTIYFTPLTSNGSTEADVESRAGFNTTQRPWYRMAVNASGPIWSPRFYYHLDRSEAIPLSVALRNSKGNISGVLGVNLFLSDVSRLFVEGLEGYEGHMFYTALLDREQQILAESEQLDAWRPTLAKQLTNAISANSTFVQQGFVSIGDSHFYFYETPLTDLAGDEYSVLTILDTTPLLAASLNSIRDVALINTSVALIVAMLLYFYLVRVADKLKPTLELLQSQRFLDPEESLPEKYSQQIRVKEFDDVYDALLDAYANSRSIYRDLDIAQRQVVMYLQTSNRLARVSEMTEDLVVVIDSSGEIKWCNTSFQAFFKQYEPYEAKQNVFTMMQSSGLCRDDAKEVQHRLTNQSPSTGLEVCFCRENGNQFFTVEAKTYTPADAENTEFFLLLSNVTQYKEQQQTLMLWKTIFDQAKWGIAIAKQDSRVYGQVNRALSTITGYSESELCGMPIDGIMSHEMAEQFPLFYEEATRNGFVSYQGDIINKSGARVPVLVSVSTVTNEDGEPTYRIASVQDLTSQVDLISRIEHQSKLSVLGELTSGIVHDFNNILGTITFNNALIAHAVDEGKVNPIGPIDLDRLMTLSEKIETSVNAISILIDQILVFAKQQTNKTSTVNLSNVITETIEVTHRKSAETCRIVFTNNADGACISGVKSQLIQLVLNLITNAEKSIIRAQREKGEICITLSRKAREGTDGNFVCIDVQDNGEGISKALLPRIFDAFKTFDGDSKSTGIGLALVKRVAELHGGWVEVHSREGEGATFSAFLPLVSEGSVLSDTELSSNAAATTLSAERPLHFVIVEDEVQLLESFKRLLEYRGHTVEAFQDSEKAFTYLSKHSAAVDILLTDYVMPNMNGKVLIEKVQEFAPALPIIVMTGYADAIDEQEFIASGANHVMIKPVKMKDLLSLLSTSSSIGESINERKSH